MGGPQGRGEEAAQEELPAKLTGQLAARVACVRDQLAADSAQGKPGGRPPESSWRPGTFARTTRAQVSPVSL
jgi:hypothetical protein